MRLSSYISKHISRLALVERSGESVRKLKKCLRSLDTFPGYTDDTDLLALVHADFVQAYGRHLFGTLAAQYSPNTLADYLGTLRSLARQAIRDGFLPALDVFPDTYRLLAAEYPAFPIDKDTYSLTSTDARAEISQLNRRYAKLIADGGATYKRKSVLIYLIGLMLRGLEIHQVLRLERHTEEDPSGLPTVTVTLPGTAYTAVVPSEVLDLVALYNGPRRSERYLIARTETDLPAGQLDKRALKIEREIAEYITGTTCKEGRVLCRQSDLRRLPACNTKGTGGTPIALYQSHSILIDWLRILAQNPARHPLVADIVRARLTGQWTADLVERLQTLPDAVADPDGHFSKRWYILASHTPRLRGNDMKTRIADLRDLRINVRRDTYDPYDEYSIRARNRIVVRNHPAVSRLLFVRTDRTRADQLNVLFPGAALLRNAQRCGYAVVPEAEIRRLILFLKDFRDEVLLVADVSGYLRDTGATIDKGDKVRILSGPFAGTTGEVLKIRHGSGSLGTDLFVITFYQHHLLIRAHLDRFQLQPLG